MNKYINCLVSITATLLALNAHADTARTQRLEMVCDEPSKMINFLAKEGEVPLIVADGFNSPGQKITIWVSNSGALTVTQSNRNIMCMLGAGTDIQIVPGSVERLRRKSQL